MSIGCRVSHNPFCRWHVARGIVLLVRSPHSAGARMFRLVLASLALFAAMAVQAAEVVVPLPDRDALVVQVPAGWKSEVMRPRPDMPPTIVLASPTPLGFQLMISTIGQPETSSAPHRDVLRRLVESAADRVAPQSVEQKLPVKALEGPGKFGYYFSATDRAPKPNEYTYLTQGALVFGDLRISFVLLANGKPEPITQQTLEVLKGLQRSKGKPGGG